MPFDSSGVASVAGQRPVNGQDTDAAQINVPLDDIQNMLSQVLLKSGVAPMTGPLNMNGFRASNIADAESGSDAVTLDQVTALVSNLRLVPVGAIQPMRTKVAPAGWLIEDGKTIGNAASGATGRANADTVDLFTHLWTQFTNTELPIQTSAGAASTRGGSAAADFAANKRMPLFDSRSRFLRGSDSGLGFDASLVVGLNQDDAIKSHTHTGTTDSAGTHSHTSDRGNGGDGSEGPRTGAISGGTTSTNPAGAHTHPFTTNATGIVLETRPRSSVALFCIKL